MEKPLELQMKRQNKKSFQGHPVNCAQIDKSFNYSLNQSPSWTILKLIVVCFWPKSNLRPILGWHRSHWRPQKFKNKLTAALFLRTNEKKHTVWLSDIDIMNELIMIVFVLRQPQILGLSQPRQEGDHWQIRTNLIHPILDIHIWFVYLSS